MQLENAPKGWKVNSTKKVYSNYLLELYEDTLDLNGKEKIYLRGVRKHYSTVVPFVSKVFRSIRRCMSLRVLRLSLIITGKFLI